VRAYCAGCAPGPDAFEARGAHAEVSVCTIEKAGAIVHRLLVDRELDQLALVVVDEAHMLGDPHRGPLLEILLTKLRHQQASGESSSGSAVQVVCLSATLPNMGDLAAWLDADLFISSFRPVSLAHFLLQHGKVRQNPELRTKADEYTTLR
jgi:replicative superfamily II helicase